MEIDKKTFVTKLFKNNQSFQCTIPKWVAKRYELNFGDEIELMFNDIISKAKKGK